MSDAPHDDRPDEARDAALIDALYDPRARADADAALTSELAGLDRLRNLYRDLPEEDPPAAATAKLMAAAAARAPRKGEGGVLGWLRGLMQPMLSPAFAAAASLVVVVGVAGLLYVKGKADLAEPRVASPGAEGQLAPAAPPASSPAEPAVRDLAIAADHGDEAPPDEAADRTGAAERKKAPRGKAAGGALGGDGSRKASGGVAGSSRESGLVEAAPKRADRAVAGARDARSDRPPPEDELASEEAGGAPPFAAATPARPEPAPGKSSATPTAAQSATGRPTGAPGAASAADPGPTPGREVVRLHAEAAARAAKGDCAGARAAASKIRGIDAAYHAAKVVRDPRLTPCLAGSSAR
jgi:hypothetical protein